MFAKRISFLALCALLLVGGNMYNTRLSSGPHGLRIAHKRHVSAAPPILTYSFEGLITHGPDGGIVGTGPMTFTVGSAITSTSTLQPLDIPTNSFTGTAFLTYTNNTVADGSLHLSLDGEKASTVLRFDLDYGNQGYAYLVGQIDPTAPVTGTYSGTFVGPSTGDSGTWYLRPR